MNRFYRENMRVNGLEKYIVTYKETDLCIFSDTNLSIVALKEVKKLRSELDNYILEDEYFLKSLVPINVKENAPQIAVDMAVNATLAEVGPMAGVAGAFNYYLAKKLSEYTSNIIIENGGDIFINCINPVKVGLYCGENLLKDKIKVLVDKPMGISTSSSKFGHSLSFGKADSVSIFSPNVILSDIVATATCNMVKSEEDINVALEFAMNIEDVSGVIIVFEEKIAIMGDIVLCP